MVPGSRHGDLMDDVYKYQRHIYDVTRKFYLLGRDRLIDDLDPPAGGRILEIGCGTGRNLMAVARRYPAVQCYGVDISTAMLETADLTDILDQRDRDYCTVVLRSRWSISGADVCGAGGR